MSRNSLGIAAALLLTIGAAFYWFAPGDGRSFGGQTLRVGLVLGALWLAFPQILALVRAVPKSLWERFAGKGKPDATQTNQTQADGKRTEPVKVKRPRRRNNA
jgi:hypothetical protein